MFGLGVFDTVKLAVLAVVVLVVAYLGWNYHHMKGVIAAQKVEIGNLQEGQRVLLAQKETVDKFMAKMGQVKRQVTYVEGKVDAVPSVPDAAGDALVLDLLKPYRMHDDSTQHPPIGGQGGLKPTPRSKTNPRPN